MILRASKLLARVLVLLVALAVLALGLFAWLLMRGPVSVAWLTPYLERELSGTTVSVDVEDTQLRLGRDRSLELSAVGVRVRDADGRLLGELPDVEIGLSTSALLLDRRIAVTRVDAVAPTLTLTRREDGTIGFTPQSARSETGQLDIGSLLIDFLTRSEATSASADLEHVHVSGGKLVLQDRRLGRTLTARDAELNLTALPARTTAELGFSIDRDMGPASLHLSATHAQGQKWISLALAFEHLFPAEFAEFAPELPLSGIRLALSGDALSAVSVQGELAPILFDVAGKNGVVGLPQLRLDSIPIDALAVRGTVAADLEAVTIDELTLASDGAQVSGRGEVAWRGGAPTLQADLEAENATMAHVERFWPPGEGREARDWVLENITAGTVPSARAQLRFASGEFAQKPLPEHTLSGEFEFKDLSVRYVDTMPPLVGVDGKATFTGQRMDFTVASGHGDDLRVEQGSVVITGIGIKGRDTTQLEIATRVRGPLQQALNLIDRPPLGYTSRLGIAPETTSGRVVSDLRIGMPLHRDLEPSEVRVAAEATLTDAAITSERADIRDGQLRLTLDSDTLELRGDAVVEGIPITLEAQEKLGGSTRRYQVSGSPDAALLRELGIDLPVDLQGEIGVLATVTESSDARNVDIALDLTPTTIAVPRLDWRKMAGQSGVLTATATLPADGPLRVTAFELTSDDLRAQGSLDVQLEPFRLVRLRLDRVHFGESLASVALLREDSSGYEVWIDAETLDLAPWFKQEATAGGGAPGAAVSRSPLRLNVRADRLIVDGAVLTAVEGALVRDPKGWRSADLHGGLPEGGQFALTLIPDGEAQRVRLTTTDAGDLMRALDKTSRIEGGELEVEATIARQQPSLEAEGKIMAREFEVLNAPLLARLLTVASLEGIGNLLGGEGIAFEQLEAPFALRNEVLRLGRGRLYGSQLGLTFEGWVNLDEDTLDLEGTIVPLYGVNWTIGQIPIIGQLLRGSEGEGAFALTYGMRGAVAEPAITVNPLSALAPGFLRELLSGLREGTLKPPEMLPSHDR